MANPDETYTLSAIAAAEVEQLMHLQPATLRQIRADLGEGASSLDTAAKLALTFLDKGISPKDAKWFLQHQLKELAR